VVALYAGLVTWLTWPLGERLAIDHPATHPSGHADAAYTAWVLAHETHALTTQPSRLLDTNIYHPTPHTLFYGPTAFGALPYFAPAFLLSGNPTLALNLTFLVSIALTASALHLVVHRWTGSHLGGAIAGWAFLTNRWTLWTIPLTPHAAVLQYLPIIVWLAASPVPCRWLVALVALQCLTEPLYLAPALLLPLGCIALGRLLRRDTRAAGVWLVAALVVVCVLLLPVYLGYLTVRLENPHLADQTAWPDERPWPSRLPWALLRNAAAIPSPAVWLIALGAIIFAWRAWRDPSTARGRAWGHSALWAGLGVLMALAPAASWYATPITLPQTLLARWLPIYDILRVPKRLGVVGSIGLALLAGVAFAECTRARPGGERRSLLRGLGPACLAAVLAWTMYAEYRDGLRQPLFGRTERLPASYPLRRAVTPDPPEIVHLLRGEDGALLDVPVGDLETMPWLNAQAMYRSIVHWRPLLNGYSSYWPVGFLERMALARRLPDPEALASLRQLTGLRAVLVHLPDLPRPEREAWLDVVTRKRADLPLVGRRGEVFLFAVPAPDQGDRSRLGGEGAVAGASAASPVRTWRTSTAKISSTSVSRK